MDKTFLDTYTIPPGTDRYKLYDPDGIGAFTSRLAIDFVIATTALPVAPWLRSLIFGILLSLPDAIITKSWAPILTAGTVGGILIGWVVGRWGTW